MVIGLGGFLCEKMEKNSFDWNEIVCDLKEEETEDLKMLLDQAQFQVGKLFFRSFGQQRARLGDESGDFEEGRQRYYNFLSQQPARQGETRI